MTTKEFQKLLDKHLKGEATAAEKNLIEQFERHFLEKNRDAVFASDDEKVAIYRELRTRIEPPAVKRFNWFKVAAVVVLFISIGYSGWHVSQNTESYTTTYGENRTVTLPDGSLVQLNGGSSLEYNAWWGKERKIELIGEAFFTVAKDKAHPFVVLANGTSTTALGTEFNVNAYPEDSIVYISLIEGSVEVDGFNQTDTLVPNQQASFALKNNLLSVQSFHPAEVLGWRSNKFVLSKTSFAQLARILKRSYGVELSFDDATYMEYTVSGRLESTDITAFLDAVSATKGLEATKVNENTYRIGKAGK